MVAAGQLQAARVDPPDHSHVPAESGARIAAHPVQLVQTAREPHLRLFQARFEKGVELIATLPGRRP